jgi:hypothetical protein
VEKSPEFFLGENSSWEFFGVVYSKKKIGYAFLLRLYVYSLVSHTVGFNLLYPVLVCYILWYAYMDGKKREKRQEKTKT